MKQNIIFENEASSLIDVTIYQKISPRRTENITKVVMGKNCGSFIWKIVIKLIISIFGHTQYKRYIINFKNKIIETNNFSRSFGSFIEV